MKRKFGDNDEAQEFDLNLTLSLPPESSPTFRRSPPPPLSWTPPPPSSWTPLEDSPRASKLILMIKSTNLQRPSPHPAVRVRRNPNKEADGATTDTIPIPFPWATDRPATILSKDKLLSKGLNKIWGDVHCKKCDRNNRIEYDLEQKFNEVATYIVRNESSMHNRAPPAWMYPTLPTCEFCGQENSCKPLISERKRSINWLFLLLGQLLGCCTLEQLKYFCKHMKNHRTGAKDRVLYLAYLALCKQLDPSGSFNNS